MTGTAISENSPYDPLDPAHVGDPAPRLAEARSRCPVSQPRPGVFVVARHRDVADALQDPASYSSENNFVLESGTETAALPATPITMLDPLAHTALRARLRQWFAPVKLRQEDPRVRGIVSDVLPSSCSGAMTVDCGDRRLSADVVVSAVGDLANTEWLADSGARPRVVPVLARYHARLLTSARFAGNHLVTGGRNQRGGTSPPPRWPARWTAAGCPG